MTDGDLLSVVVPVYGCADCLVALHTRLTDSVSRITDGYEFVFVDDRSLDDGWSVLVGWRREDEHVRAYPAEPELRAGRRDHGRPQPRRGVTGRW